MGKVIDKIKSWFKRKPRLEERYTLNRKYLGRSEDLKRFIEKRQHHCDMLGMKFSVIEDDFPDCQYGFVELVQNGEVMEIPYQEYKEWWDNNYHCLGIAGL